MYYDTFPGHIFQGLTAPSTDTNRSTRTANPHALTRVHMNMSHVKEPHPHPMATRS
jgi:hypothetical protein